MNMLTTGPRRVGVAGSQPLLRRAARAYVAGEHLSDALGTMERLKERSLAATLGYWDSTPDSPRGVADTYLEALQALTGRDGYLSIKLPALKFSTELAGEVARAAAAARRASPLRCTRHRTGRSDQIDYRGNARLRRGRRLHTPRSLAT